MTLPHTATLERQVASGNGYIYQQNGTIKCFIQPIDIETAELYSIIFTKGSNCYVPITTDLRENDRLVIDNKKYKVRGIVPFNYGRLAHKKAALQLL